MTNSKTVDTKLQSVQSTLSNQTEELTKLQVEMRRNNLKLTGISEGPGENWDVTKQIVRCFLYQEMGIKDIDTIPIVRASRTGNPTGPYARPIIVKFLHLDDKEYILSKRGRLRTTHYVIDDDYPPPVWNKEGGN